MNKRDVQDYIEVGRGREKEGVEISKEEMKETVTSQCKDISHMLDLRFSHM
jgi:hypothetical protein